MDDLGRALIQPGDRIDHYRIDCFVARTGYACVYRGTDLDTGRNVAIKMAHGEADRDGSVRKRFRHEEKIGAKLNHPSVVKVLCDELRSSSYLVTEWVEGPSLREILDREGSLDVARATRIAVNICGALSHVHGCGVVHRDLKPENVLVAFADQITLIDFGIAVAGGAQRMALNKPSEAMGTPDYISPEGVKGIRGDARSDIYALGVVLYEMLSGRTPFDGCNPLVIMNDRLLRDPIPIRTMAPEISAEVEEMICRALHRDPRRRYGTALEFARALERESVRATDEWIHSRMPAAV